MSTEQKNVPSQGTQSSNNSAMVYSSAGEEITLTTDIVRKMLVRGDASKVSAEEIHSFMYMCRFNQLNPFLNEAYLIKFGASPQMIVSKEAYLKRAESHPAYKGFSAGIIVIRNEKVTEVEGTFYLPSDQLVGGWCRVYREDRHDGGLYHAVSLAEYDKKESTWLGKKATMIRKVAIVQALREEFPSVLSGLYVDEEIQDAEFVEVGKTEMKDVLDSQRALSADSPTIHNVDFAQGAVSSAEQTRVSEPRQQQASTSAEKPKLDF